MLIVKKMRVGLQGNEIKFENNLQQFCHNARQMRKGQKVQGTYLVCIIYKRWLKYTDSIQHFHCKLLASTAIHLWTHNKTGQNSDNHLMSMLPSHHNDFMQE